MTTTITTKPAYQIVDNLEEIFKNNNNKILDLEIFPFVLYDKLNNFLFLNKCFKEFLNYNLNSNIILQAFLDKIFKIEEIKDKIIIFEYLEKEWTIKHIFDEQYIIAYSELNNMNKSLIEQNMQIFMDLIPGSVYWKNREGKYLGCNKSMLTLSGFNSISEIIGKTDFELWPESAQKITKNDESVMSSKKVLRLEEKVKIKTGEDLYFTGVKMPLYNKNHEVIGVIGNSLDITQLKKAEQHLKSVKNVFIQNMEHDIRTPFAGIWGMASYLYESEQDEEKKECLKDIVDSSKELMDFCNQIIDFSKNEVGVLPVLEKDFFLKETVLSAVKMERVAAKEKGLDFILEYDETIPERMCGDSYRIQRILINLLSNAIKFTQKGYVKLKIQLGAMQEINRDCIVIFSIEDTGIGISSEKQAFIFQKFSRLTPSNLMLFRGLGLGLITVKQFVNDLEGQIDLMSEQGKGTLFKVSLPCKISLFN